MVKNQSKKKGASLNLLRQKWSAAMDSSPDIIKQEISVLLDTFGAQRWNSLDKVTKDKLWEEKDGGLLLEQLRELLFSSQGAPQIPQ